MAMMLVREGLGFNTAAVNYWTYELVQAPMTAMPPPVNGPSEESGAPSEEPASPAPQEVPPPVPTLVLYFMGGGELQFTAEEAERLRKFFSVPSSQVTQL